MEHLNQQDGQDRPQFISTSNPFAREDDPVLEAELVESEPRYDEPRGRRIVLPLVLFVATCFTTFLAGRFWIHPPFDANQPLTPALLEAHYLKQQLTYMGAVMAILLAHEMGHFLQAVRYKVPASLPYFIPMPLTFIGTMGAVIGMRGRQANRKQLFDIGLSGPLAGLLVAVPVAWIGVQNARPFPVGAEANLHLADPLLFKALMYYLRPDLLPGQELTLNPLLAAAWVGMLITGLNMLPVSQLDGGHVAYALFGRGSHTLARAVVYMAVAYMVWAHQYSWVLMLLIVWKIGIDHPPTADDDEPLGWPRRLIGLASLGIPILCFMPNPILGLP